MVLILAPPPCASPVLPGLDSILIIVLSHWCQRDLIFFKPSKASKRGLVFVLVTLVCPTSRHLEQRRCRFERGPSATSRFCGPSLRLLFTIWLYWSNTGLLHFVVFLPNSASLLVVILDHKAETWRSGRSQKGCTHSSDS